MQHNEEGYSRRKHFGGLLVILLINIYLPDRTNAYGSRGWEFERMGLL